MQRSGEDDHTLPKRCDKSVRLKQAVAVRSVHIRAVEHCFPCKRSTKMPAGLKKRDVVKKAVSGKETALSSSSLRSTSRISSAANGAQQRPTDASFPVPPPFTVHKARTSSQPPSLFYPPSPHLLLSPSLSRAYALLSLLTFCVTFLLYFLTAYPSVTGGDSGELIISACNLGIAHPPGYPTFTLLMGAAIRLARLLTPFLSQPLSPAYVVNLSNALLGSLASTLVYQTTALLTDDVWTGLMAAFGFAFSPTVWLYSIQGEVFALNNLLCAAMAYLTVRYYESESRFLAFAPSSSPSPPSSSLGSASTSSPSRARAYLAHHALLYAYLGALCCGLAMTNQHTTVFYVLPTVLFVLYSLHTCRLLSLNSAVTLGVLVALGMSPYLYLPLRSLFQVVDSWGDQRTLSGFLTHFLRQEYGTFQLAASETSTDPGMLSRLQVYLKQTQSESLHLAPVLAVWGLLGLVRGERRAVKLSVLVQLYSYVLYVLVFHKLANLDLRPLFLGVQARFWQQANLFLFIWAACGVHHLTKLFFFTDAERTEPSASTAAAGAEETKGRSQSWLLRSGRLLIATVCVTYAAAQVLTHYHRLDHHQSRGFVQSGRLILSSFPPNSIVLLNGDLNNNIIKYPQQSVQQHAHSLTAIHLHAETLTLRSALSLSRSHSLSLSLSLSLRTLVYRVIQLHMFTHPRRKAALTHSSSAVPAPLQCEGDRPDLSLLSLQLMTWDWWVPMQAVNYPNVTFPGQRYHVNYADAFTMKQFLDANIRRAPIFLCGPWKEGDHSNMKQATKTGQRRSPHTARRRQYSGLTVFSRARVHPLCTAYYDDYPWGECARLLPAGRPPNSPPRSALSATRL